VSTPAERLAALVDGRSCPACYPHSAHDGACKGCKCVIATPCVKWAGGKRQIIEELILLVPPQFGRYFEPFVGGAALFCALAPVKYPLGVVRTAIAREPWAVLNDLTVPLMVAYRQIQANVEGVIRELSKFKYDEKMYYEVRARFPSGPPIVQAAQALYLNRIGFNGLWRVNKKGKFNVPFGAYDNPTICDAANLRAMSAVLKHAALLSGDFETAVAPAARGDFVYFDPPYWPVSGTAKFTNYHKDPFGPLEQERLRDVALDLKKRGVHVLLSNADVPEIRKLYARGFKLKAIQAKRSINSKVGRRGNVGELLIT
jgi:DNA adenine methylase